MLNEEKIILMTKLAIYEKGEGKKEIPMSRYYRNDYVGVHMLYTFLAVTAGYVLLFALYIARDVEGFLSSLTTMDLKKFLFFAVVIYAFAQQIFLLITWMIYRQRFTKNREHLNEYNKNLKKLKKLQKKEDAAARKIAEGKEAEGEKEPKEASAEENLFPEEVDLFPDDPEEEDIFREPEQPGYFKRRKAEKNRDDMDAEDGEDVSDGRDGAASDEEDVSDGKDDAASDEEDISDGKQDSPRRQAESQDPDLLLDEVMKELMSYNSDDDEEDEDGFTFSS